MACKSVWQRHNSTYSYCNRCSLIISCLKWLLVAHCSSFDCHAGVCVQTTAKISRRKRPGPWDGAALSCNVIQVACGRRRCEDGTLGPDLLVWINVGVEQFAVAATRLGRPRVGPVPVRRRSRVKRFAAACCNPACLFERLRQRLPISSELSAAVTHGGGLQHSWHVGVSVSVIYETCMCNHKGAPRIRRQHWMRHTALYQEAT